MTTPHTPPLAVDTDLSSFFLSYPSSFFPSEYPEEIMPDLDYDLFLAPEALCMQRAQSLSSLPTEMLIQHPTPTRKSIQFPLDPRLTAALLTPSTTSPSTPILHSSMPDLMDTTSSQTHSLNRVIYPPAKSAKRPSPARFSTPGVFLQPPTSTMLYPTLYTPSHSRKSSSEASLDAMDPSAAASFLAQISTQLDATFCASELVVEKRVYDEVDCSDLQPAGCPPTYAEFYSEYSGSNSSVDESPSAAETAENCLRPVVKRRRSRRTTHLPPRPPNAFILYRRYQQAHLRRVRPGLHLQQTSRLIGEWWRGEGEGTRERYRELAARVKREHQEKFPGFRYKTEDGRKEVKDEDQE